jgi:hypothetical protein
MAFNPETVQFIGELGDQLTNRQFTAALANVTAHESTVVTQEDLDEYNRTRAAEPLYVPITLESWAALVASLKNDVHLA